MPERLRGMELVARKGEARKPMMKRKPGMAVMIAIGGPKPASSKEEKPDQMEDEKDVDHGKMSKAEHIAYLQEKIASLKAELALLEDEDESEDMDEASESDGASYEDED